MKKGSKMSQESINKIKAAKSKISIETRKNMSESRIGKKPWNAGLTKIDPRVANNTRGGWKQSDEAREKMREAKVGFVPWNKDLTKETDERVAQQANKLSGVPKSEEHCRSISLSKLSSKPWNNGLDISDERVAKNTQNMTETKQIQSAAGEIIAWNKNITAQNDERIKLNPNNYKGLTKETSEKIMQATQKQSDTMKQMYEAEEIIIWNKGLTSETDSRVKSMAKTLSDVRTQLFNEGLLEVWNKGSEGLQDAWNKGLTKNDHKGLLAISLARINYMINNKGKFISSQEYKVADFIASLGLIKGIDYFQQFYVGDIESAYLSDIFILKSKTIIEIDGVYWHTFPGRLEEDETRTKQMIEKGYNVIRFTDIEVNKEFELVKEKIIELLKK